MPTYDYLCPANGRVVEVSHKMAEQIATWGDLPWWHA
jgi:predicted nucleic acid-binding Zn ribbon protein